MNINFDCPQCGQNLEAPNDLAGAELACPNCSAQLRIPTFDPQGRLGAATLVDAQPTPTLEPPRKPVHFQLRPMGQSTTGAETQCPNCKQGLGSGAVICVHCGYDLRNRRSLRTRAGQGGGGASAARFAVIAVLAVLALAGAFVGYDLLQRRHASRRAAALKAREQEAERKRLAEEAEARRLAEEKARQAEEELRRKDAARKEKEERLAHERTLKRKEYDAKNLFLDFSPWSSQSGNVVSARVEGYGSLWVVLKTKTGDMLAVERGKLSAHDQERLRDADAILKAGTPEWDEYARNMAATQTN